MLALAEHQILCLHRRESSIHSPGEFANDDAERAVAEKRSQMLRDMEAMLEAAQGLALAQRVSTRRRHRPHYVVLRFREQPQHR